MLESHNEWVNGRKWPLKQSCVFHVETEIRDHGVGFFEFSKDEETRQQQLEALKKLRQQVICCHRSCIFVKKYL